MVWIKQAFIRLLGNHRIQGISAGLIIGIFGALLLLKYQITKVDLLGIKFERTIEQVEKQKLELAELKKKLNLANDRIVILQNKLEQNGQKEDEFYRRLVAIEAEVRVQKETLLLIRKIR